MRTGMRLSAHSMRSRPASASLASAIFEFDIRGTLLSGRQLVKPGVKQSPRKSFTITALPVPNALPPGAGMGGRLAASRDRDRAPCRPLVPEAGGRRLRARARQGWNLLHRRVLGRDAGVRPAGPADADR